MRTAADRAALRARRPGKPLVVSQSGTAAALRLLGHEGTPSMNRSCVVSWTFPPSAASDLERATLEFKRASAERYGLWREGPPETPAAPAAEAAPDPD